MHRFSTDVGEQTGSLPTLCWRGACGVKGHLGHWARPKQGSSGQRPGSLLREFPLGFSASGAPSLILILRTLPDAHWTPSGRKPCLSIAQWGRKPSSQAAKNYIQEGGGKFWGTLSTSFFPPVSPAGWCVWDAFLRKANLRTAILWKWALNSIILYSGLFGC